MHMMKAGEVEALGKDAVATGRSGEGRRHLGVATRSALPIVSRLGPGTIRRANNTQN